MEQDTVARESERARRALRVWRKHGAEFSALGMTWRVPSVSIPGRVYVVDARTGECECSDRPPRGEGCKHFLAVVIERKKRGQCAGCGRRFRFRYLTELTEDNHDNLTYFHGDRLCAKCADNAGVAR